MRRAFTSSLFAGVLACACLIGRGQDIASGGAKDRVKALLDAPLRQPLRSDITDIVEAVRDILGSAQTYGGAALIDDCGGRSQKIAFRRAERPLTLKESLEDLTKSAPNYKWTTLDGGGINVLPVGDLPKLLETQIAYFDWDSNLPMGTAIGRLSNTHELRQRELELQMTQIFFGGPVPPPRRFEEPPDWHRVEHVSALAALNAIAKSYRTGVWVYSECRGGNGTFQIVSVSQ